MSIINESTVLKHEEAASKAKESPASVNPSEEKSTEVRFRDIIKEARQRVSQAKLGEDELAELYQIQHELDFLKEATAFMIDLKARIEKLQQPKVKKAEICSSSKQKGECHSNSLSAEEMKEEKEQHLTPSESEVGDEEEKCFEIYCSWLMKLHKKSDKEFDFEEA